jgi:hypothetical protein
MFDEYASSDMMNLRLLSSDFATASLAAGAAAEVEAKLHILHRIQKQGYPDKLAAGGKMHNISHLIKAYKSIQKEIDKLLRRHGTGFAVHH